ncbi:hypothetical protein SLA2020_334560 [Shorea laevis]
MAIQGALFFLLLFLADPEACCLCNQCIAVAVAERSFDSASIKRSSFPVGFVFGAASSAYQYEGAASEGGRGPSIWDTFTQRYPDKIRDHSSGEEDVAAIRDIGFDAYRFSISWSRLLPDGKASGGVNQEGIRYYNSLINGLLANGLQPYVTLFHWDLPQALQDEYGGFLNPQIVNEFRDYAELCYKEFGDRVKHWITLNEPLTVAKKGYATGEDAPGRCSNWYSPNCTGGDSGTEPYVVAHNLLLAHAAAVKVYRDRYQMSQKGEIGITLNVVWTVPSSDSKEDRNAAFRALAFMFDWFMEPLYSGFYPNEMVTYVEKRLPQFPASNPRCYLTDSCVNLTGEWMGIPIGPKAASDWFYVYPQGIYQLLLYIKYKFNDPAIYITENGVDEVNDGTLSLEDDMRIDYYNRHLPFVESAIKNGVNVKGYFAWSLLANFEWADGYTVRFGIIYVDYNKGLKRYRKKSAAWFKQFLPPTHFEY